MCYCTPSIRTPFCSKCNQVMFLRIKELGKQRDELLAALNTIIDKFVGHSHTPVWVAQDMADVARKAIAKCKEEVR